MIKRRSFFGKIAGLTGAIGFASLPSLAMRKENKNTGKKPAKIPGRFVHMVFFWLNDGVDADEFIQTTAEFINQVKEINSYHLGKPAGTPRELVDNSYSVSLVVTFDSKEDQDIYQKHPVHVQYVEDNSHKWNQVQIYDSWGTSTE